jgi:hypothetical protein
MNTKMITVGDMVRIAGLPGRACVLDVGLRHGRPAIYVGFIGTKRRDWYFTADVVEVESRKRAA